MNSYQADGSFVLKLFLDTGGQGYLAAGRMADARELVSEMSSRGLSANKAQLVVGAPAIGGHLYRHLDLLQL